MSRKGSSREDISNFFQFDIYLPTRTIYLGSNHDDPDSGETGVDSQMTQKVIKALHILDNTPEANQPISIIMNNPGGDVYHGLAIYDAIKNCQNQVKITVYGYCMSMGSVIMQAADERVMSENSRVMLHYGENGYHGHSKDFIRQAQEAVKLNNLVENIYYQKIKEKKAKFTKAKLAEILNFDTYLSPKQALELGLIDRILE